MCPLGPACIFENDEQKKRFADSVQWYDDYTIGTVSYFVGEKW